MVSALALVDRQSFVDLDRATRDRAVRTSTRDRGRRREVGSVEDHVALDCGRSTTGDSALNADLRRPTKRVATIDHSITKPANPRAPCLHEHNSRIARWRNHAAFVDEDIL